MTDRQKNPEWEKFTDAMRHIVSVPYSTIKAKLEEENKVRRRKRTRKSKVRAFHEANGEGQSSRS